MKKRAFVPAEGVSNIELFYDLIFVYCISVLTSLMHHVHGDFFDIGTYGIFAFSYMVVIQVWLFTTFLMNRYGDHSASDTVCLIVNMFLLYFLAQGIRTEWTETIFTFNFAWALIILNLLVHWLIKLWRYDNLSADDRRIMISTAAVLAVQFVIVLIAAFLPPTPSEVMSWVGMLFGAGVFTQSRLYRRTESRFGHLVERCSLIVIIAFGETVVAIASYVVETSNIVYPLLVFALVVGLFLIYIYEHDNMIDHHKQTDGMGFLTVTGWVIFIIGNLTVGLEYMIMPEVAMLPKSIFLVGALVLYLLTSFVLGIWNKPQFTYSYPYILGRVCTCAFIVLVSVATGFDPLVTLVCDTIAIYFALWHEWRLYRGRTAFMAFSHSLGITRDDIIEYGYDIETHRGRREFLRDARARIADGSIEECVKGKEAVSSDE